MIADVTDTDELATGLRREGIYFGIMNFGEKVAAGGALFLAGSLLSVFRQAVPRRRPTARRRARRHAVPGTVIRRACRPLLLLISLIFILPYRLDRRAVHGIQQQLAARAKGEFSDNSSERWLTIDPLH